MADSPELFMISRTVLTKDQLASIGAVAVEATHCDLVIEVGIWSLTGMDMEQGKFFTTFMQADKKIDLLGDLGKQKLSGPLLDSFTDLIGRLKTANGDRNAIIHGLWDSGEKNFLTLLKQGPENSKVASATKRRLKSDALVFSAAKVDEVAIRFSNLRRELVAFYEIAWPWKP